MCLSRQFVGQHFEVWKLKALFSHTSSAVNKNDYCDLNTGNTKLWPLNMMTWREHYYQMITINVDNSNNSNDRNHTCVCLTLTTVGYGGLGRGGGQGGLVPGGAGPGGYGIAGAGMKITKQAFRHFFVVSAYFYSGCHNIRTSL